MTQQILIDQLAAKRHHSIQGPQTEWQLVLTDPGQMKLETSDFNGALDGCRPILDWAFDQQMSKQADKQCGRHSVHKLMIWRG